MLCPSIQYISLSCVNQTTDIHTYILIFFVYNIMYIYDTYNIMLYIYIYLLLSRPDSPVQIPRYIMLSMSCCIVLIPLIDRLRPLKCTKHQHCPKPRLYAFHLDPILIPGHSILICWMSSRKHLLILPTWVLAIMSLTCNTNINNFFPHPSRYHLSSKNIHYFLSFQHCTSFQDFCW